MMSEYRPTLESEPRVNPDLVCRLAAVGDLEDE
jgi:hypothetical protein